MGVSKMNDLNIKIYADGANVNEIIKMDHENSVDGFTTNPTLMLKAGVSDYLGFAREVLSGVKNKSISFEVFSDDLNDMYKQALILRDLGENVWVKIPVSNTQGIMTYDLINKLSLEGVKVNVTAIFTKQQIQQAYDALNPDISSIISIFAGRIANAGVDPEPTMKFASDLSKDNELIETLWASSREVFNIIQAIRTNTNIITLAPSLINGSKEIGKDLDQYSLETVKMFYNDAKKSGFSL
ncbi:MAG TPA: transaldolase [Candidatus Marinimicrobia bacterium]|nr:transaldolase [Candidatus Neomarinimicrobiota bacterium]